MLMLQTKLRVDGITGKEIFDFLADPNDQALARVCAHPLPVQGSPAAPDA